MILEHKANGQEFLIVEVPEDVKYWNICIYPRSGTWIVGETDKLILNAPKIQIPSGTYSILFTAEEATEEQAAMVVDRVLYDLPPSPYNDFQGDWDSGYRDYECEEEAPNAEFPYVRKSTDSLSSLIRSKFTDHANHKHLVIEKID